jgi:hypothetical protein
MGYAVVDACGFLPDTMSRSTVDQDFPFSPDQTSSPPAPAISKYPPLTGTSRLSLVSACLWNGDTHTGLGLDETCECRNGPVTSAEQHNSSEWVILNERDWMHVTNPPRPPKPIGLAVPVLRVAAMIQDRMAAIGPYPRRVPPRVPVRTLR